MAAGGHEVGGGSQSGNHEFTCSQKANPTRQPTAKMIN